MDDGCLGLFGVVQGLVHDQANEEFDRANNADNAIIGYLGVSEEKHKTDHEQHDTADDEFASIVFREQPLQR